jgi:hypothetical protein
VKSGVAVVLLAACAPLPPPRAVVTVHGGADPGRTTVLAMPTTCVAADPALCTMAPYATPGSSRPPDTGPLRVADLVDPIVHLELELAGYTIADARTLRLVGADRTDTIEDSAASSHVEDVPTVAQLSAPDRLAAARSLGLTAVLQSTVTAVPDTHFHIGAPVRFELVIALVGVPDGAPIWTVRCSDENEGPDTTLRTLGKCVGDGVLAWRAPDAVLGRQP